MPSRILRAGCLLILGLILATAPGATAAEAEPPRTSPELAADPTLLALWDPAIPFPPFNEMPDLDIVTHVQVERAKPGEFHYLHETAIAWHKGLLHMGWANHPLHEANYLDELLRGGVSRDGGLTWSEPVNWIEPPAMGAESWNHPVLAVHQDRLWGFFTRWVGEQPETRIFTLDEQAGRWQSRKGVIPGFLPFTPPRRMRDGNWIIGGEQGWTEAAVAISRGDDFTNWELVILPRPEALELRYPETTLLERGDALIAICRPPRGVQTAPVSISHDCGRSWTSLQPSNFPLWTSKPLSGRLSTGQQYLIANNLEEGRTLLSIAVTEPGSDQLVRIWKIRHQAAPVRRLLGTRHTDRQFIGGRTEWSYPAAIEHDGLLYVSYTQGKEDAALSIIPLSALEVR